MPLNQENLKQFSEPLDVKCTVCKKKQSWICKAASGHWFAWCAACESVTPDVKTRDKAIKLFEDKAFEIIGRIV